ncbi:hypothetical protein DID78_00375 [Candidatus Marinamargulisbacteria bacterium SCGC AG-343-D04]|nr:hypothetical protein DID78_00375 [Candidatus Marinamargulisbacteria bacterium SCGC AG-343-D04]
MKYIKQDQQLFLEQLYDRNTESHTKASSGGHAPKDFIESKNREYLFFMVNELELFTQNIHINQNIQ